MIFRAHELIANLKPESEAYRLCCAAVKFELGEVCRIDEMAGISRGEFLHLPATVSLFQVSQDMDVHFFLAKEDEAGITFLRFGRQLNDGFRWHQEDVEITIGEVDGQWEVFLREISSGRELDFDDTIRGFDPSGKAPDNTSVQWTVYGAVMLALSLEVFACCNVATTEHNAPKFINRMRVAKGKVPFFSYKTLYVTGEDAESVSSGGTHNSPRLHLRRGHIRRLPNKRVWVRECLVGDKRRGLVLKDYVVRRRNASTTAPK